MAKPPSHLIEQSRRRGRGAASNLAGRFEVHSRQEEDDGWGIPEERPRIVTEVREEKARSLISYNRSPDLPFDRSINPYRGCEHGCIYCFARPSHAYLGLSPGLDFETRLVARPNAAEVLERELSSNRYKVAPIAIGTNTDAYQPAEKERGIMRDCLEVLEAFNHPVAIVTKGSLIERDLDILARMAEKGLVRVGISVTTMDDHVSRVMEPRVPRPERRLMIIRRLVESGVPVRVMVSPIIPALTDHEIERILKASAAVGATSASWIMLRLPREVSELVQDWLHEHFPHRANRIMNHLRDMHGGKEYDPRWGRRMRGEGSYAEMIAARFDIAAKRLGLDRVQSALRCDQFRVPPRSGDQMNLF
ncbi:MAG: radical SAM protein [Rhodobacterales bacterium]|nr:MAG: radical SAM protein [Rhodobacterales bacterium]